MHAQVGHGGYPPGYYGQGQPHGQFRPPSYPHMNPVSNPSFQSMTSHWNITGHPSHLPHPSPSPLHVPSGGGGSSSSSSSKAKHNQLGQYGMIQQPKAPDKPLLPYMRYSRKMWEELKAEGKRVWEVGKIIGQKWREMPDEDKQPYFEEYEQEKAVYNEQMKVYRSSPAYKRWLDAKQQAEQVAREAASLGPQHSEYGPPPPSVIAPPRQTPAEARIQMMQQEDEEDEYITMKQLAAVRFHRNHRLMAEIFNDVVVPDMRTVVTKSRLAVLKKQVQSLLVHQKKLEEELKLVEARFEAKKKRFREDSEKFRRELKRIHDNPPSTWKKSAAQLSAKDLPQPIDNPHYTKL